MSRRSSIFEDVMCLPWPVGVVLAFLAFIGQQVALSIEIQSPVGHAFKAPIRMLGYFFVAMFLLAAFVSFFNQVIRARPNAQATLLISLVKKYPDTVQRLATV